MHEFIAPPLSPIALFFTIAMCLVIVSVGRKYIIIPLISVGCLIPSSQLITIFGSNFSLLRIVIIAGLIRITLRHEWSDFKFNTIDKLIIYFFLIKTFSYTVLWSSSTAFISMLGQSIDILGTYFLIRTVIHDFEDYDTVIKTILLLALPIMVFILFEHISGGYNVFSIIGGVAEQSAIRDGKVRAQGAFPHSILAGTFGASLLPLVWGLRQRGYGLISTIGIISSLVITLASSSSGPVMTLLFCIIGIFLWKLRNYTKIILNLFFFSLIFLHFARSDSIWWIIADVNVIGGSTGYHRAWLIDAAVTNFSQWFLFGIESPAVWDRLLWDVTNQYLAEGFTGGIVSMILFIVIMAKCFSTIGSSRAMLSDRLDLQKYVWSLGTVLFAYAWTFISVSFFGQMIFFYYLLIGMISSLTNIQRDNNDNSSILKN